MRPDRSRRGRSFRRRRDRAAQCRAREYGPARPAAANGADALAALRAADPSFNTYAFLAGARTAFETIVKAFAAGDTATLQPLLSPEVFTAFSERPRAASGEGNA